MSKITESTLKESLHFINLTLRPDVGAQLLTMRSRHASKHEYAILDTMEFGRLEQLSDWFTGKEMYAFLDGMLATKTILNRDNR